VSGTDSTVTVGWWGVQIVTAVVMKDSVSVWN
jgi:hypothetical protein